MVQRRKRWESHKQPAKGTEDGLRRTGESRSIECQKIWLKCQEVLQSDIFGPMRILIVDVDGMNQHKVKYGRPEVGFVRTPSFQGLPLWDK